MRGVFVGLFILVSVVAAFTLAYTQSEPENRPVHSLEDLLNLPEERIEIIIKEIVAKYGWGRFWGGFVDDVIIRKILAKCHHLDGELWGILLQEPFREPKEGGMGKNKFKVTIWMNKEVYAPDEPITLYIELLKTEGETIDPSLLDPTLDSDKLYWLHTPEQSCQWSDSVLIVKKEDEDKYLTTFPRCSGGYGFCSSGPFVAEPEEIEYPEVRARMKPVTGRVYLNPGESIVLKIHNIRELALVPFTLEDVLTHERLRGYLDYPYMYVDRIEGHYRMQFVADNILCTEYCGASNIIDFWIR